jgi:hypothetical protein
VPFQTQIDGTAFSLVNCGPASLSMVLNAFGVNVDPASVRDYLNFLIGNYNTEQGTSLYVLGRIAREAGLNIFGVGGGGNLQGWTVDAVREQVRAGHPVITLTKYRRLPGHFGSVTEFDHYIVITGLAGEDFVYNDAAYATEYGYDLLISPAQLERAWADSSVPRHALAIGLGEGLHPLPIVPHGLTAESLAAPPTDDQAQVAPAEMPVRMIRGPAAERLREEMLDRLGSKTAVLDSDLAAAVDAITRDAASNDLQAPPTRLDPADVPVPADQLAPVAEATVGAPAVDTAAAQSVDGAVPASGASTSSTDPADAGSLVAQAPGTPPEGAASVAVSASAPDATSAPSATLLIALLVLLFGVALTVGGGLSVWRRRQRSRSMSGRPNSDAARAAQPAGMTQSE